MGTTLYRLTDAQLAELEALLAAYPTHPESALPFELTSIPVGHWNMLRVSDPGVIEVLAAQTVPQFIAQTFGSVITGGLTVPPPAHEIGDIIVCHLFHRASVSPSGFDGSWPLIKSVGSTSSSHRKVAAYAKRAASNAETVPTISVSSGDRAMAVSVIRGVKAIGSVADVVKEVGSNWSTTATATPSLSSALGVPTNKALILGAMATPQPTGSGSLLSSWDNSDLANITTRRQNSGTDLGSYMFTAERDIAGAISNTIANMTAAYGFAGLVLALEPA